MSGSRPWPVGSLRWLRSRRRQEPGSPGSPRRAGERGAVETGCLPHLLPGGRPLDDAEARTDLAAAWGVRTILAKAGRDTATMLADTRHGVVKALLVGGVEIADLPDPTVAREALAKAQFVVSLEVRHSEVTSAADVVLPVAPVVEKPGSFVNWEGRVRSFDAVLHEPNSLTDIRVLAGIAEGSASRSASAPSREPAGHGRLGPWDGARATAPSTAASPAEVLSSPTVVLDTWRQMIDDGRGQDGQAQYHATARPAVLRAGASTFKSFGIEPGETATISTSHGSTSFPTEVADVAHGVVWVPANSGSTCAMRWEPGSGTGSR
ncbi:molybdopterin-dependent oxidoreductase [Aeromicrobium sp. UC242_57]|uniref:molybdopterin-dependent oxidoreductase n=1 Tax=Aeromicrobium sp. UC242_57 TaxID=3374624 RepID=UPI0037A03644